MAKLVDLDEETDVVITLKINGVLVAHTRETLVRVLGACSASSVEAAGPKNLASVARAVAWLAADARKRTGAGEEELVKRLNDILSSFDGVVKERYQPRTLGGLLRELSEKLPSARSCVATFCSRYPRIQTFCLSLLPHPIGSEKKSLLLAGFFRPIKSDGGKLGPPQPFARLSRPSP